jgi:hypothetical protein
LAAARRAAPPQPLPVQPWASAYGLIRDDPVVRVFTYQTAPVGSPEEIAEEAFAICNGHPSNARGEDLAHRYYERELRSLSFP